MGRSVVARPMAVQFGWGAMKPFQPRFLRWTSISLAWSALTVDTNSGTSASMR